MHLLLDRKVVMKKASDTRGKFLYEVLMKVGLNGFVKKFNVERQARPLVKHDWLYE